MQSGNPDTGLGDSIVNAIMKTHIHGINGNWSTIICGDDSLTVTTLRALQALGSAEGIRAAYAKLGMEVTIDVRMHPLAAEFCSGRFQPHYDSYILVPKTGKMLARAYWDIADRSPANQKAWARGVSLGLLNFGRHNPLYGALADNVLNQLGRGRVIRTCDPYSIFSPQYTTRATNQLPFDEAGYRAYHAYHYGMTSAQEVAIIQELRSTRIGQFNEAPSLQTMFRVDLCPRG
jgi:hypothetical protein